MKGLGKALTALFNGVRCGVWISGQFREFLRKSLTSSVASPVPITVVVSIAISVTVTVAISVAVAVAVAVAIAVAIAVAVAVAVAVAISIGVAVAIAVAISIAVTVTVSVNGASTWTITITSLTGFKGPGDVWWNARSWDWIAQDRHRQSSNECRKSNLHGGRFVLDPGVLGGWSKAGCRARFSR